MKNWMRFGLFMAALTIAITVEAQQAGSILRNPGFEVGRHTPSNWEKGARIQGVQYIWDKKVAFKGKASLCLKKTAQRFFPIAKWGQRVMRKGDLPALQVKAQVKAEKVRKAVIDVIFYDKYDKWISHKWAAYIGKKKEGDPAANHDWREYSGKVQIPERARMVRIEPQIYGPGTVWFDDVHASYVE